MGRPKFGIAASVALINAITVGICSTYSSTATESMKSSFLKPTDEEISWIGSIVPLAAMFGGILAGYLSEKIGRKGVMMYLSVLLLTGWLLISYTPSLSFVYAGRFLTGLCCGLICVVTPMYIVEISTPEVRGRIGCRFQLFICIGIILVSILGKYLVWNWVAICGSVVAVLAPLLMLFIPESPCWLLKKERHAEAASAIRFLYGNELDTSSEFINENYKETRKSIQIDLRDPTVFKPALLSVLLMFFQQFSGSNAVLYYTVWIFKEAKSSIDPTVENILVACIMFLFTLLSSLVMDRLGRKMCLNISGAFMGVSLVGMCFYVMVSKGNSNLKDTIGWIPLLCILVYIAAFSIGLGPIPWLMMSEMSPTHARSFICGLGTAFSWMFAFAITKSFNDIQNLIYGYGAYWIYAFFCFLTCGATYILPETKGKSLEEIVALFVGNESHIHRLEEEGGDEELRNPES